MTSYARLDRPFLILIAVGTWSAIALQVYLTTQLVMSSGGSLGSGVVLVFSYFTVLTNLIVAVVVTACLLRGPGTFLSRPATLSAVAVYIFMVGLIYALLLRNLWAPTGLQLVADIDLHQATPTLFVLYWLFFVRKGTLRWVQPITWLIYPLAYIAYSLLYGVLTGRYLYHFADVSALGYPRALANAALVLAAFLVVGLIAVAIDRGISSFASRRMGHPIR